MGDHKDVLIAAYLFEDLAKQDFDAVLKLAEAKTITVEGVVLVQKDADGEVHVVETGDHLGRRGLEIGGGVGLVVGLFAPPLLAATAVGAAAGAVLGRFAKHRLQSGIAEKMDTALPPGSGGARERSQEIRGPDRRHECEGAQGRTGRSSGRDGRLSSMRRSWPPADRIILTA
jgi:uncharacterized membrane protein